MNNEITRTKQLRISEMYEKECNRLVEEFLEKLQEKGSADEIEMLKANDLSSDLCKAELVPKLAELSEQMEIRQKVVEELEKKKDIATSIGSNADVGKIHKAIAHAMNGDYSDPVAKKVKKEIDDQVSKNKKATTRKESELSLQELVDKYNFHMTSQGGLFWLYQTEHADQFGNRKWVSLKKDTLQANFSATAVFVRGDKETADYSSFFEFTDMLRDQKRYFTAVNMSYTDKPGVLNMMNKNFCPVSATGDEDYHWIFDAIYESVSGGEPGSVEFEQFQQIVFSKYMNPSNAFLPNAFVRNPGGRCGKDLYSETHLRTLFGGNVATNCNIDHLLGKFNGAIAGKAVIVVNETVREKVDVEKIKQFLGSKTLRVENKYEMPYEADNTALVISFTNALAGGVSLSGEKSDERYALFSTDAVVRDVISKYFLEKEGIVISPEDCKKWLESNDPLSGQNILASREENSKWIAAMARKWGKLDYVAAYKSRVYDEILNRQRGAWLDLVEQVFTEPGFDYIRDGLLMDMITYYCRGEALPGRKRRKEEIERLCKDKGINVIWKDRVSINDVNGSMQRTVWKLNNGMGTVKENEVSYGVWDDKDNWKWTWRA
jgi:hypothetical protein